MTSPESFRDPGPVDLLAFVRRLGQVLDGTRHLGAGLSAAGLHLRMLLGARSHERLQVRDWDPDTALVSRWPDAVPGGADLIDLDKLVPTQRGGSPLGDCLAQRCLVVAPAGPVPLPWQPPGLARVLLVPVLADGCPVAVLELHDPGAVLPDHLGEGETACPWSNLLQTVQQMLGQVARREREGEALLETTAQASLLGLAASRLAGGLAITDREGVVEWINPTLLAVSGRTPEEVLGQPLWVALGVDDALPLNERFARGLGFRLEYAGRRGTDGHLYAGEVDALLMCDEPGARLQFVCLCNDIGERRRHEAEQRESREMLAALTEHVPISLVVLDARFRVVSINRHAEVEFGTSRELAPGRGLDEVLGAGMHGLLRPQLEEALRRPGPVEHEFPLPTVDGQRDLSARHLAVRDPHGEPRLLVCQLRDITERRRAENDLRESEARYEELIRSLDDGVFMSTPERDRFHFISPRLEALWGRSRSELDGDPTAWRASVHPDDLPLLAARREKERRLEPTDTTFRIHHPTQGLRWVRQRTRTRVLAHGEVRVFGLITDVTEEREQAQQLKDARDQAEALSQAKSQFMANMSHEIRTPMNGILGMTELLLGTTLTDRQRRFAAAVYRSGEMLLEIIGDILDYSKIEAGRLELAPTDFSLRGVVEDTLELLAPRAHEKGLELSFRELGAIPGLVNADPLRLRQVLTNLVANAIKFTERGEIVVELEHRERGARGAPEIECRVRDTGIGILPEVRERLFTAFSQGHTGNARRYGGTGLGLAISRQLVRLMGGDIDVRSSPGLGSEFHFTIALGKTTSSDPGLAEVLDMPTLRVLVVEDNPTNRTVLDNMLRGWGMRVTLAHDGQHALDLLETLGPEAPPFDLAVVDWRMPRLDGIGFARGLRERGLQPQMKLVMLSSVSLPDDVRQAQEIGFLRFVHKPVRKTELRQVIQGVTAPAVDAQGSLPQIGKDVLVIEDNKVNQEVVQHMLQALGCRVRVAGSAVEGLLALCERRFDVILMDIQMPGMDGVSALNLFRAGPGARYAFLTPPSTPVLAVTANALAGDEERYLNMGFNAYLSKPFRMVQLLQLLTRVLGPAPGAVPAVAAPAASAAAPPSTGTPTMSTDPTLPGDDGQPPPLDAQALQRLRDLDPTGQNRLVERVLQAFETSIDRMSVNLDEALTLHDLQVVRHVTHTLKSSAASVGAFGLSRLCADTEALVRQGQSVPDLPGRVAAIQSEMRRVRTALRTALAPATVENPRP